MSEFRREPRYVVVKIKDIEAAGCTPEELAAFNAVCDKVSMARAAAGKQPLGCVVVEQDWRCYEHVWHHVELEHAANEARKKCHIEGHKWELMPVAGDGETCARCKEWRPEQ